MSDHSIVSHLTLGDLRLKRYADGSVMLSQGSDLVYLEVGQLEPVMEFIVMDCLTPEEPFACSHDVPELVR